MKYGYKIPKDKEELYVRARYLYAPISTKAAVEIAKTIKNMFLPDAIKYLEDVIAHRRFVPYSRYTHVSHRPGTENGIKTGRYPEKACKYYLKMLKNLENNARQKNLDPESLRLVHVKANKGPIRMRYKLIKYDIKYLRKKITHIEVVAKQENRGG